LVREARRLGLVGLAGLACAIGAFLVSSQPQDIESSRYLVAVQWFLPLALAPLAQRLGAQRFALVLTPWLACAAAAAAISIDVPKTLRPLPADGLDADDRALRDTMRARGLHGAWAQYWVSYRLTYLFREDPIVVPIDHGESRYAPYDLTVAAGPAVFVLDPLEPRARFDSLVSSLRGSNAHFQLARAGRYLVVEVR
jgi:hypothetical protein